MGVPLHLRLRRWLAERPIVQNGRRRRYELFASVCVTSLGDTIVDVGSGPGSLLERYNDVNPITALDIRDSTAHFAGHPNVTFVVADATAMPFGDNTFDVAFSNSVIEHLPVELREPFAREIRRVARRYFVQTPNRHFPIEPHYWLPFVQYAPARVQDRLAERLIGEPINLLTAGELSDLFPEAKLVRERFLGLTKSLIVIAR